MSANDDAIEADLPDQQKPVDDDSGSVVASGESGQSENDSEVIVEVEESLPSGGTADSDPEEIEDSLDESETVSEDSSESSAEDDSADDDDAEEDDDVEDDDDAEVSPIEDISGDDEEEDGEMLWYILKVQVNRENSICDALARRVKIEGLEKYFDEILVPTEDVREFTKTKKQRIVKRKLYPGYIVVRMILNDDSWFAVRETPGIGDFTGAAGKPAPLSQEEIDRIIATSKPADKPGDEPKEIKIGIKFKRGDSVRIKTGSLENFEGEVSAIDETNGQVTVMISMLGQTTPVQLEHWDLESIDE